MTLASSVRDCPLPWLRHPLSQSRCDEVRSLLVLIGCDDGDDEDVEMVGMMHARTTCML